MAAIEYTITFSVGAVVGFCIRMVIEDKIIRRRDKDKRYEDAYNIFAQAFNQAIHMIDKKEETSYAIVYYELPKQREAMLNFAHLPQGKIKNNFMEKWVEYENKCKEIEKHGSSIAIADGFPGLFEFENDPVELQRDNTNKEKMKILIEDLLKVARK
jgi:hypothetical protein